MSVVQLLELVSEEFAGRVELEKTYYKALTDSVREHFKGNGVISSMQQCNDFMFLGTEAISLGRVGMFGYFWRANLYVSNAVGEHNFKLLKSLALPDGTILRCQCYALPTRDCLFEDPLHDDKTMLKIWNLNKHTGVLGLFNCQGGGWCRQSRRNKCAAQFCCSVSCSASPKDIEWNNGKKNNLIPIEESNTFAVYMFREEKLKLMKFAETFEVSHEPLNFELLTVSPVKILPKKAVQFAPIGLVNMLNTAGSIQSMELSDHEDLVRIGVKEKVGK
ncbi:hypothetical protein L484_014560 [Morus notabilis]|uniref:Galactinol--sucrose galactosyltransferase n=1 Tax=Morus notabilis TaxID=981085 RepID=W9RIB2_9ROSA|nr:hypothetical protein L484_014560 [Morus notabilis]